MSGPWSPALILTLLATEPRATERALLALYRRQTTDERQGEVTTYRNGLGFNATDAGFLTSCARFALRSNQPEGWRLTTKQREAVERALRKYAGQLTAIANAGGRPVPVRLAWGANLSWGVPCL